MAAVQVPDYQAKQWVEDYIQGKRQNEIKD